MTLRPIVALFGGFLFCACALWTIQRLIEQSVERLNASHSATTIEFVKLKPPIPPPVVEPEPAPEPPRAPPIEDLLGVEAPLPPVALVDVSLAAPRIDLGSIPLGTLDIGLAPAAKSAAPNSPPRPLSQPRPAYPSAAARRGIEGWVRVSFTVNERGSAIDARVVAAKPRNVFNRAALQVLRRWRFKPALVNGDPVARRVTQTIAFELAK